MRFHFRYRPLLLAALAISSLAFVGLGQPAGAAPRDEHGFASAPGQLKKTGENEPPTTPSAGTPTAADVPEGFSAHDEDNGPGGQVCDGDPSNEPGAGGNYENTCPAGPSQNGAGGGQAIGKPCSGCVGNADDKNPPGQASDGPSDHNNGYECDQKGRSANEGNNGVGFGNPAHTGCVPGDNPPLCPDGSAMPASGNAADCTPKCPDGSAMPASGNAADCSVACVVTSTNLCTEATGGGSVLGETLARPAEVLGVTLTAPSDPAAVAAAGLARTGADLGGIVRLGSLLALLGLVLALVGRNRRSARSLDTAA